VQRLVLALHSRNKKPATHWLIHARIHGQCFAAAIGAQALFRAAMISMSGDGGLAMLMGDLLTSFNTICLSK